jgi:putative transposase
VAEYLIKEHEISERQAFKEVGLDQSAARYKRKPKQDAEVTSQLQELMDKQPPISFWQSYYRIRRKGFIWNHKRIYWVYTDLERNIRRRYRKRLPSRTKQPLGQPEGINEVWSVDCMSDSLWDGRKYRLLNIVDDYNRQVLHIEADTSLPTAKLIYFFRHRSICT